MLLQPAIASKNGGSNPAASDDEDGTPTSPARKRLRKGKGGCGSAVDTSAGSNSIARTSDGIEDDSGDDTIYVCGYEQFHRHLRNSELTKFIADKFSPNTV